MIQKQTSKPLFFIQCGDWETITSAKTPLRACVNALALAHKEYAEEIKLSPVVIAMNIQDQMEQKEEAISAFTLENLTRCLSNEY